MQIMIDLHKEVGNTIIMITHDAATAQLAKQQYVLRNNTILQP